MQVLCTECLRSTVRQLKPIRCRVSNVVLVEPGALTGVGARAVVWARTGFCAAQPGNTNRFGAVLAAQERTTAMHTVAVGCAVRERVTVAGTDVVSHEPKASAGGDVKGVVDPADVSASDADRAISTANMAQTACSEQKEEGFMVFDMVWGRITLPRCFQAVIHTHVFQRLRFLAQTGMLSRERPTCVHNRLSHCVGVAFASYSLIKGVAERQPELGITAQDVLAVTLAGLCHDLGHGPASHTFSAVMDSVDPAWSHEQQTVVLMQHMFASNPELGAGPLSGRVLHAACEMVVACKEDMPPGWSWVGPPPGREFLYDIVNAQGCGLDTDKVDYLLRDTAHVGASVVIGNASDSDAGSEPLFTAKDAAAVLQTCRVDLKLPGEGTPETHVASLAWPCCVRESVARLFGTRFLLHAHVYQSATVRCAEAMVQKALIAMKDADVCIGVCSGINCNACAAGESSAVTIGSAYLHPPMYTIFTDWLIHAGLDGRLQTLPGVSTSVLRLFACLARNQLWSPVAQYDVGVTEALDVRAVRAAVAAADALLARAAPEGTFHSDVSVLHHGKGSVNPLDKVQWWSHCGDGTRTDAPRFVCGCCVDTDHGKCRPAPTGYQRVIVRWWDCRLERDDSDHDSGLGAVTHTAQSALHEWVCDNHPSWRSLQ